MRSSTCSMPTAKRTVDVRDAARACSSAAQVRCRDRACTGATSELQWSPSSRVVVNSSSASMNAHVRLFVRRRDRTSARRRSRSSACARARGPRSLGKPGVDRPSATSLRVRELLARSRARSTSAARSAGSTSSARARRGTPRRDRAPSPCSTASGLMARMRFASPITMPPIDVAVAVRVLREAVHEAIDARSGRGCAGPANVLSSTVIDVVLLRRAP